MKIKHMIVVLFIILSVIPLSIQGLVNMFYYNGKLERLLENDLRVAVSTQVRGIENFFNERRTDADILADSQPVRDLLKRDETDGGAPGEQISSLSDMLKLRVRSNPYIEGITILDRDFGVLLCSSRVEPGEVSALKELGPSYFGPELKFTHVMNGVCNPQEKVVAAVQGIYEHGRLIGYISMEVNLRFFEETRESAKLFNNGTIYLVDHKDQMITAGDGASSRYQFVLSEEELKDYKRAWSARDPQANEGDLKYRARGDRYLSYYIIFGDPEWRILSSVNVDEVLQPMRAFGDLAALVVITLAILLVLINYFVYRSVSIPVHSMIDKFKQIQVTGDYSVRMNQTTDNEVGTIARGIDALLDSIENYLIQEKREQERLREKAERDPMTGLFNKETMYELLRLELERSQMDKSPVACLFIDIDDFKAFNTRFGHMGGDQVLCFMAETLNANFPGMAGRQGGDEFIAVVSGDAAVNSLERQIKQFLAVLNEGVALEKGGEKVPIGCCVGAAVVSRIHMTCEELITRADEVMYEIKSGNKNGYRIWKEGR